MERQVYCLGRSEYGEGKASHFGIRSDPAVAIACGDAHSAVVTESGRLFVFGKNEWGQLGLGHKTKVNKPTHVAAFGEEKVKLVACGRSHTLVATDAGRLYACGANNEGQLGAKTASESIPTFAPVAGLPAGTWRALACGGEHSAALTEDGQLYVWGANNVGQLGLGSKPVSGPKQLKIKGAKRITHVACGYYHTVCSSDRDDVFTFGETDGGKLGLGDSKQEFIGTPTKVAHIEGRIVAMACGSNHTVVITATAVFAWGDGSQGQLGLGESIEESTIPVRLNFAQHPATAAVYVACGEVHTAIVSADHKLYTCGSGQHGRLGHHATADVYVPQLVAELVEDWDTVLAACGGCHTLAIVTERPLSDAVSSLSPSDNDDNDDEPAPAGAAASRPAAPALVVPRNPISEDSDSDGARPVPRPQSARQRRRQIRSLSPITRAPLPALSGPGSRTTLAPLAPLGPLRTTSPHRAASPQLNAIKEDGSTPLALSDTDDDDDDATNDVVRVSPGMSPAPSPSLAHRDPAASASSSSSGHPSSAPDSHAAHAEDASLSSTLTSLSSVATTDTKGRTQSRRWPWRKNAPNPSSAATAAPQAHPSAPAASTAAPAAGPAGLPRLNGAQSSKACTIL
eukprot:m.6991 g.6991  ORF g.6991 m.6991 type:complete len:627 (-) comp4923_c0_seq1:23-1903(-)